MMIDDIETSFSFEIGDESSDEELISMLCKQIDDMTYFKMFAKQNIVVRVYKAGVFMGEYLICRQPIVYNIQKI